MMNARPLHPLILASASPRRRQILTFAGIPFEVRPADIDEDEILRSMPGVAEQSPGIFQLPSSEGAGTIALSLARAKARAAQAREPGEFILAADTIVVVQDLLLGKPHTDAQAERMLTLLSGKDHRVITAHVLVTHQSEFHRCPETVVTFRELSDREIQTYINGKEPHDKAGAYAIQGDGAMLIDSVCGDFLNVVGLSLTAVRELVAEATGLGQSPD